MTLVVRPGFSGLTDADAMAYVAAVEAADGQLLEFAVGKAINDFVVGCKLDGTWSAIKACCIMAGARTLAGALVPLVGPAPTNNNFVSADYNRKTGIKGNASTKYLISNVFDNSYPIYDFHLSCNVSVAPTANVAMHMGGDSNDIYKSSSDLIFRNRNAAYTYNSGAGGSAIGFIGQSRAAYASYSIRVQSNSYTGGPASASPVAASIYIFARGAGTLLPSDARMNFYSIGTALNLVQVEARVTSLINAFGVAIP